MELDQGHRNVRLTQTNIDQYSRVLDLIDRIIKPLDKDKKRKNHIKEVYQELGTIRLAKGKALSVDAIPDEVCVFGAGKYRLW